MSEATSVQWSAAALATVATAHLPTPVIVVVDVVVIADGVVTGQPLVIPKTKNNETKVYL